MYISKTLPFCEMPTESTECAEAYAYARRIYTSNHRRKKYRLQYRFLAVYIPHFHDVLYADSPLSERITFRLAVLAYRCLYGSAFSYLASELFPVSRASRQ